VAIELRNWLAKEMNADVAVLKFLEALRSLELGLLPLPREPSGKLHEMHDGWIPRSSFVG